MNLHPALLAILGVDLIGALLLCVALVGAARVVLGWQPGSASQEQLSLERTNEEVSALARFAFALHAFAAVLLVIALNHVLPAIVPGAMCGVGALQAMPGSTLALSVRGVALAALWVWAVIDQLDRSAPLAPLATVSSRALLVAGPAVLVAAWQTTQALLHVNVQEPVSCCAAVYDLAAVGAPEGSGPAVAGTPHAIAAAAGLVALLAGAMLLRRQARRILSGGASVAFAMVAASWVAVASWVLVDVAGPYLYGALGHRCPLCFFLPHHRAVGYGLYGALMMVMAGSLTVATAGLAGSRFPPVEPRARQMTRRATLWVIGAAITFALLSAGPAVWWRARFGVWIDG